MAHYAYVSPDRQSVLVVEMDQSHAFNQPCRLMPFDGSSAGRQVGPQGTCTSAAWSPDGKWMYFGATLEVARISGARGSPTEHRSRSPSDHRGRRYCGGAGRPVVGDIDRDAPKRDLDSRRGRRAGDLVGRLRRGSPPFPGWHKRVLSLCAGLGVIAIRLGGIISRIALDRPRFGKDRQSAAGHVHQRLRYFERREGSGLHDNGQQRRTADLAGVPRPAHATSPDRSSRRSGVLRLPRTSRLPIAGGEDEPAGADQEGRNGARTITAAPVLDKCGVSPDGEWVLMVHRGAWAAATLAVPIHGGGPPRKICAPTARQVVFRREILLCVDGPGRGRDLAGTTGKVLAIPVPAGKSLPDLPVSGINVAAARGRIPGARMIEQVLC